MKRRFVKTMLSLSLAAAMLVSDMSIVSAAEVSTVAETTEETAEETTEDVVEGVSDEELEAEVVDATTEEETEKATEEVTEEATEEGTEEVTEETTEEATEEVTEETTEEATEETTEEETEEATEEETEDDMEVTKAATASISNVTWPSFTPGSSYNTITVSGYAYRVEIKVNGTVVGNVYGTYDEDDAAPAINTTYSYYNTIAYNTTYKIVVTPYTSDGKAGTAVTKTVTTAKYSPTVKVKEVVANNYSTPSVSVNGTVSKGSGSDYVEVYRSTNKDKGYKLVGSTYAGSGSYSYYDSGVVPGTKYYYKVRVLSDYQGSAKSGYSNVKAVTVPLPAANTYATYDSGKILVEVDAANYASRYDLYRSTSKSDGYKKIATIAASGGTATYSDSKISNNTTYYYKAIPYYYNRDTQKSYKGKYTDPAKVKTLLGSINNYKVVQTSATKVKVSWSKVSGANLYEIYTREESTSGDAYKKATSTTGTSVTITIPKNTDMTIQLRAYRTENGEKKYDSTATSYVSAQSLSAPRDFYVSSVSMSKSGKTYTETVNVKWSQVFNAKKYVITYVSGGKVKTKTISDKTTTSAKLTLKKTVGSTSSATDSNGSYYYDNRIYIKAVSGENSSYNASTSVYLNTTKKVSVSKNNATSAKITWEKVSGATTYYVYRRVKGTDEARGTQVKEKVTTDYGYYYNYSTSKTSMIDSDVTPGIKYEYYVVAYNNDISVQGITNFDKNSTTYSLTKTAAYTHKLGAPTISSVKNTAKGTMTVTIKASAYQSDAISYTVYRSTSKDGKFEKVGSVKASKLNKDGKTLTYKDTSAKKGKTYYYKVNVKVNNEAGLSVTSGQSKQVSAKCKK